MIKTNTKSMPTSFEDGLQRVCEESKFGFLITQRTLLGLGQNISCKLVDIRRAYYTSTVSFIINRGSPYKGLFTRLWVLYNYVPIRKNFLSISHEWLLWFKNNFQIWNTQSIKTTVAHVNSWNCKKHAPSVTIRSYRKKREICSESIGL